MTARSWYLRRLPWIGRAGVGVTGLLVVLAIVSPASLQARHLLNLLRQAAPLGIAALGQTVVLVAGGIDLSIGAIITLTNVLAAQLMAEGSVALGAGLALAVGAVAGAVNGAGVAYLRVPPFVMTLGMSSVITGASYVWTRGTPVGRIPESFRVLAQGWLVGTVPYALLLWLVTLAVVAFLMHRTVLGRWIFATGGNPKAAHAAAVPTRPVTVAAYALSGFMAAISGLLLSAYVGVASLTVGAPYTLETLAAAVLGGTSLAGGEGTLGGTFLGAVFLLVLRSILIQLQAGEPGRLAVQGLLIIGIIGLYNARRPKSA